MGVCFYPKRHPIAGGFTPRAFGRNLTVDRPIAGRIVRISVPPSFRSGRATPSTCKSAGSDQRKTGCPDNLHACSDAAAAVAASSKAASVLAKPLKKRLSSTETIAASKIPDSRSDRITSGVY